MSHPLRARRPPDRPTRIRSVAVASALAVACLGCGEADDDAAWDAHGAWFESEEQMAEFEADFGEGLFAEDLEAAPYAGDPGHGGFGYEEEGAFRGEAEVGGVPLTSGTVDTSGGGNSVYSVGGKVIELP